MQITKSRGLLLLAGRFGCEVEVPLKEIRLEDIMVVEEEVKEEI
jgi:hypothetical protein